MKSYPSYKDSGIEWIGEIPEFWKLKRIKHTSYVKGRIGWKGLKTDEFLKKGYAYLVTGTDFNNGIVEWDKCHHINKERYDDDPYIQLHENDLLITKDGTIGKVAMVKNLDGLATLNSGIFVIRPTSNDFLIRYMYWILISEVFKNFNDYTSSGSTIKHLYQNVFLEFKFPLPPLPEQTAIADFLDQKTGEIDLAVKKGEERIRLLKEYRAAVIHEAVTRGVPADIAGIDQGVEMKESGIEYIGEIPEHWEVKKLKWLIQEPLKYGANKPANDNNPDNPRYIRITDFGDDGNLRENTFRSLPYSIAKDYLLENGDLLFARSGATVGKTFQFKNYDGLACFAGYLIKAKPDEDKILSDFLYYYTRSNAYENWKNSIFIQATIQNIGADKYKMLPISLPPIEEQRQIVEYIETETARLDAEIRTAEEEIRLLQEYREALISEAVTGKIDVRDYPLN